MNADIQAGLESLFQEALSLPFAKKTYEDNFKKAYENNRGLFAQIISAYEMATDREQVIAEIASIIPDKLKEEMREIPKRKQERLQIDYNAAMVTYVLPLLTYSKNEGCEAIADQMVIKWNAVGASMQIQRAAFEDIQGGFKNRLCYVTTAVCRSLNKPDDCYELNLLRDYRDHYLLEQAEGKAVIREYYDVAPTIVKRINKRADAAEVYRRIWAHYLSPCITCIESDEEYSCQELYTQMVQELQQEYIFS